MWEIPFEAQIWGMGGAILTPVHISEHLATI
jgi:hypothetical protein